MRIYRDSKLPTEYGKGTHIELNGDELAHAIDSYLYAIGVHAHGPRTIRILTQDGDSGLCGGARVYVDPSGRVLHNGDEVA